MFYLGSHKGSEDDGYIGSGYRFLKAYKKRPQDFRRRIIERISEGDIPEIHAAEQRWLNQIKPEEFDTRYYNRNSVASGFDSRMGRLGGLKGGAKGGAAGGPHKKKDENGRSLHAIKMARLAAAKIHAEKDAQGRSLHALRTFGKAHDARDEKGRSLLGLRNGARFNKKNEDGKSIAALKGNATKHAAKDENGKSIHGLKCSAAMLHQRWHVRRGVKSPTCSLCGEIDGAAPENLRAHTTG